MQTAGADRGRGFVCAKAVGGRTSRGVGTSVTARIPNACVWCGAGKRRGGKPGSARTTRSKPSTPRQNVRAVSVPYLRRKPQRTPRLQRRVVTQQIFLSPLLCDRPGCHEPPPKVGRNQARYCCPACRQALRRVLDRERKWQWRGTFQGRRRRAQEYQAARARRGAEHHGTASAPSPRPPPA